MHCVCYLGQVAIAVGRYDRIFAGRESHAGGGGELAGFNGQAESLQLWQQGLIERGHAVIVEARGLRAVDRHFIRLEVP